MSKKKKKKNITNANPVEPAVSMNESEKIVEETLQEIMEEINELEIKEAGGGSADGDKTGDNDDPDREENKEESEQVPEDSEENAESPQENAGEDDRNDSEDAAERDNHSSDAVPVSQSADVSEGSAHPVDSEIANQELQRELDQMDEQDEIDEAREKADQALNKHRVKKRTAIVLCSILGVLIAAYLGSAYYFSSHFYPFTVINGTDQSMKKVADVEAYLTERVADYSLTLEQINGGSEMIEGSDISILYKKSDELQGLLKQQNPFFWPQSFFSTPQIEASVGVEYDQVQLEEKLAGLECMKEENQTPSVSAYPKFDGNEFIIEPEVIGTQINSDVFKEKVAESVNGLIEILNMEEAECYLKPQFLSDSQEVLDAAATMNDYLKASITYEVSPQVEVVDKAKISEWVAANEALEVTFNEEGVREFVSQMADKYNTVGTTRSMTTANGNSVEVKGGNFGWRINQDEEYNTLLENIRAGEEISREPVYSQRGADHGESNDYGNTYVEVDLSNQYLWFFKEGSVVLESGIVTGKPSRGNATPQGSYRLTYKTRNAVLRGTRRADGTYDYETPVSYWMPFNGGIGFHDATWQSSFGGSRYLTNGSHGCVNLPYSVAEQLYGLIQEDTPIILHY